MYSYKVDNCSLLVGNTVTIGITAAQALGINAAMSTNVVVRKVNMMVCLFIGLFVSPPVCPLVCINTACYM